MKRLTSLSLLAIVMLLASCQKDEDSPLLILTGSGTVTIELNSTWTEPGYTASDTQDGDITDKVIVGGDIVDSDMAGTYEITYSVSDKAGNTTNNSRTVYVVNSALNRGGLYNVTDTTDITTNNVETYQVQLIPSLTENNVAEIMNFRSNGNNCKLKIKFQGITQILVDSQRPDLGAGNEADVSGAGQVLADQSTLRIGYLVEFDAGGSETGIMRLVRN